MKKTNPKWIQKQEEEKESTIIMSALDKKEHNFFKRNAFSDCSALVAPEHVLCNHKLITEAHKGNN
jgi:hypothetical protein